MKDWDIVYTHTHARNVDYFFAIMIILFVLSLLLQSTLVFALSGVFATYLILLKYYNRKLTKILLFDNKKTKIRLFPGDQVTLAIPIQNKGILPFMNGVLECKVGTELSSPLSTSDINKGMNRLKLSASFAGNKSCTLNIPIVAEQRGTTKIQGLSYTFPHLLLFSVIEMKYKPSYQTEFIIYPQLKAVTGVETVFQYVPGEQRVKFSPYEDIQNQIGIRDYTYTDSFQRINWTASIKAQKLQSNVYAKTADLSFVFVVNLNSPTNLESSQFNHNLENLLSYTAYLCQYASKNGLPYEISLNARRFTTIPYYHLPEGAGNTHYLNSLELLARIRRQAPTIPMNQMLYRIGYQLTKPKTIIIIGDVPSELAQIKHTWRNRQHTMFQVKGNGDSAIIVPIVEGAIKHAQ